MKRIGIFFFFVLFSYFVMYGQMEHYEVTPKFPYGPTVEEVQKLPNWYQRVRTGTPPVDPVTALAEFHPMGGVMIAYPLGIPVSLVRELSMITSVKVLVYPASDSNTAKSYFQSSGVNIQNVDFWVINHDSYWTRDYGPWFIIDGNDEVGVVDFTYNRPNRPHDDAVLQQVASTMNRNRYEMPMVHTGGNYMVDGYGTAASTSLILEENPMQTTSSIATMTQDYLGINNYLITNDPLGEYIAHIDCWGKFLSPNKVLIAQVPTSNSRYTEYEFAANFFANATNGYGEHYQVYRVFEPGGNWVTPYTNSLIVNDHVFVPVTGTSWDDAAVAVYEQAMPGYTIVPIMESLWTPWRNTDALHCRTHELADPDMLFIKHYPPIGEQPATVNPIITAEIKPLSGSPLVSDSVLLYYRVNKGDWNSTPLLALGRYMYEATLSNVNHGESVEYYLFAKDMSGRRAFHPFIGAQDPHHFTIAPLHIEEKESVPSFEVFPNPFVDKIAIRGENIQKILIYNSSGSLMWTQSTTNEVTVIPCHQWAAGVYMVVIEDTSERKTYRKVVKSIQ